MYGIMLPIYWLTDCDDEFCVSLLVIYLCPIQLIWHGNMWPQPDVQSQIWLQLDLKNQSQCNPTMDRSWRVSGGLWTGDQSVDISTPLARWSAARCDASVDDASLCSASDRGVNLQGFTPFISSPWYKHQSIYITCDWCNVKDKLCHIGVLNTGNQCHL